MLILTPNEDQLIKLTTEPTGTLDFAIRLFNSTHQAVAYQGIQLEVEVEPEADLPWQPLQEVLQTQIKRALQAAAETTAHTGAPTRPPCNPRRR